MRAASSMLCVVIPLESPSVDNTATSVYHNLNLAKYNMEIMKWTFDKYVKVHMDQHHIITDLPYHGYKGMDERSKVRNLLNDIKIYTLNDVNT